MTRSGQKTVILICGPTATGKTAVAIRLAEHFGTEIISADSRQCYKELNIGVARPSEEELKRVKHHFIASHRIQEEVTAAGFEKFALEKTGTLFREQDVIVMAGGTGLYIRAFCEGLDEIPEIDPSIRETITRQYEEKGLGWLQQEIKEKDPAFYLSGEIQNPQRMMRAFEVIQGTGKSILSFRKRSRAERDFRIIKLGIDLPKEELNRNINARVDAMMEKGLLAEVRSLMRYRSLNALQTVGYTELYAYLDGALSLDEAIAQTKTHTRQYAKRQSTWFKRDREIQWFGPGDTAGMINAVGG